LTAYSRTVYNTTLTHGQYVLMRQKRKVHWLLTWKMQYKFGEAESSVIASILSLHSASSCSYVMTSVFRKTVISL